MVDVVNHPEHYSAGHQHECIEVLKEWMGQEQFEGFLRGNILKYLCREDKKGTKVQDLKKAQYYLNRLITEVDK